MLISMMVPCEYHVHSEAGELPGDAPPVLDDIVRKEELLAYVVFRSAAVHHSKLGE